MSVCFCVCIQKPFWQLKRCLFIYELTAYTRRLNARYDSVSSSLFEKETTKERERKKPVYSIWHRFFISSFFRNTIFTIWLWTLWNISHRTALSPLNSLHFSLSLSLSFWLEFSSTFIFFELKYFFHWNWIEKAQCVDGSAWKFLKMRLKAEKTHLEKEWRKREKCAHTYKSTKRFMMIKRTFCAQQVS